MSMRDTVKQALEFDYRCAACGAKIREGEAFAVLGTMSPAILHGAITNTLKQVELLGKMHCGACARAALASRP
jgi:hypothetical protein